MAPIYVSTDTHTPLTRGWHTLAFSASASLRVPCNNSGDYAHYPDHAVITCRSSLQLGRSKHIHGAQPLEALLPSPRSGGQTRTIPRLQPAAATPLQLDLPARAHSTPSKRGHTLPCSLACMALPFAITRQLWHRTANLYPTPATHRHILMWAPRLSKYGGGGGTFPRPQHQRARGRSKMTGPTTGPAPYQFPR